MVRSFCYASSSNKNLAMSADFRGQSRMSLPAFREMSGRLRIDFVQASDAAVCTFGQDQQMDRGGVRCTAVCKGSCEEKPRVC